MAIILKSQNITNMYTPVELVTTNIAAMGWGGGGVTDHGLLHGLGDNDHPQYLQTVNSTKLMNTSERNNYYYTSVNTFASLTHTHGSISTVSIAGSVITNASASSGLTLGIPNYLTTAMVSNEGSRFAGTNFDFYFADATLNSSGFSFDGSRYAGTGFSSESTTGLDIIGTNSTGGLSLGIPKFITTAAQSDHSHGSILVTSIAGTDVTVASASTGFTLGIPKYITTAYGAAIQGSGSYTQNTGVIQFVNSNGVTFGLSNDGVMTASVPAVSGAQTGISAVVGGAGTATSGTIIFSNSNGISFGMSDNTMTALYTVPAATVFSNSNNVSFGLNNSTITAIFSQSLQTSNIHNITLGGNVSGTPAEISSGTLTIAGGNNITILQVGNAITISAPNIGGLQTGISGIVASNTTYASGTVIWSGQNNITINTSSVGASQYVQLSVGNYLTTAMQSASSSVFAKIGFTTQSTAGSDAMGTHNTDGLNLGVPKWLTTAAQISHTHGSNISSVSTAGSDFAFSSSSNGMTFGVPKYLTTAAQSVHTHDYQSTGAYLTTARYSTDAIGLNTAKTNANVKWTVNSSGISLDGSAIAGTGVTTATIAGSVLGGTLNTSGLSLGVPAWMTAAGAGGAALRGSGTYTQNSGTVQFVNSNAFTFGLSSDGVMTASGGFVNTSETGNLYFGGGSNITWNSSVNGNSTSIMATAGGGTGGGAGNLSISAGTLAGTRDYLVFSNSNSVSFGMSGSTITASISSPAIGTVYFSDGSNITFGSSVNGVSTTITASVNVSAGAGSGTTTGTTSGTALKMTLNATGLNISYPNWLTTAAGGGGGSWSTSTQAGVGIAITTGAATNTLYYGNFLTTAANSTHTHDYQSTGAYLTTQSAHTQFVGLISTGLTGGSWTINSSQLSLNIPAGSIYYSDLNGVTFGVLTDGLSSTVTASVNTVGGGGAGTGFSSVSTGGTAMAGTLNSNGLSLGIPAWLTAAGTGGGADWATSAITGSGVSILTGAATNTLQYGPFITTYTQSTHTHDLTQYAGILSTGITGGSATLNSQSMGFNIPQGSLYFNDGSGISWGATVNSISTTITGSVVTSYLSASLMPLSYSSGFQTDTLAGTFMDKSYSSGFQTATLSNTFAPRTNVIGLNSAGTNMTWTVNSSGVSINGSGYGGTATTIATTSGDTLKITFNSAGLNISHPKFVTTYAGTVTGATNAAITVNTSGVSVFGTVGSVTGATGGSITVNTSGISINIPIGTVFFQDSNGHSFVSSVGTGTASLCTTIYISI